MSSDLIVRGFGEVDELLDISPFVHKLEAYLRLAELPYLKKLGSLGRAPRGKLPYIEHEGRVIGDSQHVIEYLRERGLADLDAWLSPRQRALATALRTMLEEDLYFTSVHFRWIDDTGWRTYGEVIAEAIRKGGAPGPIAGLIAKLARRGVKKDLHSQGTGRHTREELIARARSRIAALVELSEPSGPWLLGERPSSLDAVVHAFVVGMRWPAVDTPLRGLIDEQPRLLAWLEHADAKIRR